MNNFFGYFVVEKLKFISFDDEHQMTKARVTQKLKMWQLVNIKIKLKMLKTKKLKNH